jgi:hypothetical protein
LWAWLTLLPAIGFFPQISQILAITGSDFLSKIAQKDKEKGRNLQEENAKENGA